MSGLRDERCEIIKSLPAEGSTHHQSVKACSFGCSETCEKNSSLAQEQMDEDLSGRI